LRKILGLAIKEETQGIDVMYTPIKKLGLCSDFNFRCKTMGFKTLHEVTLINPKELVEKVDFPTIGLANWLNFLVSTSWFICYNHYLVIIRLMNFNITIDNPFIQQC
jgi:hypothetical protein